MTSGKHDVCPSASPDGQFIAYTSESSSIPNPGGEFAGYELRFVNKQTMEVGRTWTPAYAAPRFSPDGSMLAAISNSTLIVRSHPAGVRRDLGTANYAQFLSWSPDSKWIIVERDGPVLELVNAETGLRLPLGFTGYMRYPSWRK
jgi:Tol biopolymer transport system component